jgi:F-type H+-transporting ATPase subunit delta
MVACGVKRGCVVVEDLLATAQPGASKVLPAQRVNPLNDPRPAGHLATRRPLASQKASQQGVLKTKVVVVAASSPIVSGIAGRYATALFELAAEAKALDKVDAALDSFLALLDGSEDLQRLVSNPVFTADEQVAALNAIFKKAKITGLAANFLGLVAAKRRLFAVRGMIAGFKALLAEKNGIVAAEVTVAAPLSDKNRAAVLAALEGLRSPKRSIRPSSAASSSRWARR